MEEDKRYMSAAEFCSNAEGTHYCLPYREQTLCGVPYLTQGKPLQGFTRRFDRTVTCPRCCGVIDSATRQGGG
jgi:hypothetical protein